MFSFRGSPSRRRSRASSTFSVPCGAQQAGAAQFLGENLVYATAPLGRLGALAGVYVAVMILTELITNNAAAALLFPVAMASAEAAGIPAKAMCYIVMFAASASFMTPIGYQTNLMVYGPGGYRFSDFIRFGAPLQLMLAVITVLAIYLLHVR